MSLCGAKKILHPSLRGAKKILYVSLRAPQGRSKPIKKDKYDENT